MKIEDIEINNWEPLGIPPGQSWWEKVESEPSTPLIVATIKMILSYKEYKELLRESRK